ncbi:hypothetical protein ACVWZV_004500 [Bradyrhizobium sp. GM5.1]
MVGLIAGGLGAALVLWPQSIINQHYLGTLNPFVHSGSLYVQQVFFGLSVQRHECAYFVDPSGIELLRRNGISFFTPQPNGEVLFVEDMSQLSLRRYVALAVQRPLDITGIYVRHVINGLTLLSSNIYACAVQPRWLLNLGSITTVVLAVMAAFLAPRRLIERRHHVLVWAPLVPVLLTVPTAMEGRFFLAVHLFAYAFLCLVAPWRELALASKRHAPGLAVLFVITLLLASTLLSGTYSSAMAWLGADEHGVRLRQMPTLFLP